MRRDNALVLVMLLVIFGFWLFGLEWLHMRPDEHLVYQHTSGNLVETIRYQAQRDVQAPLWHSFFWNWRQVGGDSEFVGRYQGVLWSVLTLALVYRFMVMVWGRGRDAGHIAIALVAVNAYFFTYAFEIRPYPIVMLSATFSMWSFYRWIMRPSLRRAVFYGVSLALLAYIHYFLVFLVIAQGVYFVGIGGIRSARMIRQYTLAIAVAALIWSPWMPTFLGQVAKLRQIEGSLGIASTTTATTWPTIDALIQLATNDAAWLVLGVLIVGMWQADRRRYGVLVLWGVGVPMIAFTANLFVHVYDPRYISYLSVGVSLALAATLARVPLRAARIGMAAALMALMGFALPDNLPDRETYRPIFRTMSAMSQPDDVILFDRADEGRDVVRWQIDQYIAPDLLANTVISVEQAQSHRRVWHVTANWFDAQVGENFRELERTHPVQTVLGRCDGAWCYLVQLMEGPPLSVPMVCTSDVYDNTLYLWGGEIRPQPSAVMARLWWSVDAPTTVDYSVSVRLLDTSGTMIAAHDAPPARADGTLMRTSTWEAGRTYEDWRIFDALPSGTYQLQVIVYEPIAAHTLACDGQETTQLNTITIP